MQTRLRGTLSSTATSLFHFSSKIEIEIESNRNQLRAINDNKLKQTTSITSQRRWRIISAFIGFSIDFISGFILCLLLGLSREIFEMLALLIIFLRGASNNNDDHYASIPPPRKPPDPCNNRKLQQLHLLVAVIVFTIKQRQSFIGESWNQCNKRFASTIHNSGFASDWRMNVESSSQVHQFRDQPFTFLVDLSIESKAARVQHAAWVLQAHPNIKSSQIPMQ